MLDLVYPSRTSSVCVESEEPNLEIYFSTTQSFPEMVERMRGLLSTTLTSTTGKEPSFTASKLIVHSLSSRKRRSVGPKRERLRVDSVVQLGLDSTKELSNKKCRPTGPINPRFSEVIKSVKNAINSNVHPIRIVQGSSGSYFCLRLDGKKVGVFKPKNEEPYGQLNPKWTKWAHRNLFPCCFGRSCLIPNLGYISEAGASLIDRRLSLSIVPQTEVVDLASTSFHYSYLDLKASQRKKRPIPLPTKIGSFQLFLDDYVNANVFLRDHPWPYDPMNYDKYSYECKNPRVEVRDNVSIHSFCSIWTSSLQREFREQVQKLVVLDYLIRNTDRGLDNWMVRYYFDDSLEPHIHIAAIDHGLAFPYKHPDRWRSYPYAWLSLPSSLIGGPFLPSLRKELLSSLTSHEWWQDTLKELRQLFSVDRDFNELMFERQVALLKGQAWNLIQTLEANEGPLELCQRKGVVVWGGEEGAPPEDELVRGDLGNNLWMRVETLHTRPWFTGC
ncbi:Phosphatidylinositol 4-kinase LSB6 [Basidiobolus ranarum]|uniref:Phosphatidylinositol 4-kinase n=1 Tax=Basidiobolus ranarum TaxID=34480 RepID=A0ABR2WTV1_9FUNG